VLIYGKYEIQVLDLRRQPHLRRRPGRRRAPGQHRRSLNASRPPGERQTYDHHLGRAAHLGPDAGKLKRKKAYATVLHNGAIVQNHTELYGSTPYRALGNDDKPMPPKGGIYLYEHHNPRALPQHPGFRRWARAKQGAAVTGLSGPIRKREGMSNHPLFFLKFRLISPCCGEKGRWSR
jgi:hypothetical protein